MTDATSGKQKLKVLITVKTYPIPSAKYDELVCTAGVTETGDFVRLYPINFRDLPSSRWYKKYQWIEVIAERYQGRDVRKESYRPDCDSIKTLGKPIPSTRDNWAKRAGYVLQKKARSMEALYEQQKADKTSLGIFKPKTVHDLVISRDDHEWKPSFMAELRQARLWETRTMSKEPPRKVPFKFQYHFECDDRRCMGKHRMMIEDWEIGRRFWRMVDDYGMSHEEVAKEVRGHFLNYVCGPDRDTYFYVGTILAHPKTWVVIGVFWPKIRSREAKLNSGPTLFDAQADT